MAVQSFRELDALAYIKKYIKETGYPPTVREIAKGCGMSSTSVVTYHLAKLERQGKITRTSYTARGIVVNE